MSDITESRKLALHYMQTLIDVSRESFLILDSDLRVILANPVFYQNFQVSKEQTENKFLYDLGNGQWNIPELKELLEDIIPERTVVRDYDVTHIFETIGEKTMILNARQIDTGQLIILAIEDITIRKTLEKELAKHTKDLEVLVTERTEELVQRIAELEVANKNMVGRELRMVELKKENEALRQASSKGGQAG